MRSLDTTITQFFLRTVRHRPGDGVVVAFSGGPDSTALLLALSRAAPSLPGLRLVAAHMDHGLDPGSAARAARAAEMAERIGVPFVADRRPIGDERLPGESLEAAGRRVRYAFLEAVRLDRRARWIATAHHRDDQAETVVLRILFGTGIEGLAGIPPVRDRLVRPLLSATREDCVTAVREAGLEALDDPTNRDPFAARNRVRHTLLPALAGGSLGPLRDRLVRLADAAAGARSALERRFETLLAPRPSPAGRRGLTVAPEDLLGLPRTLLPHALAFLHRRAGAPYPAGAAARGELVRQLTRQGPAEEPRSARKREPGRGGQDRPGVGCDVGDGWRWIARRGRLELRPPERARGADGDRESAPALSYRLEMPGEVEIPELGLRVTISRQPVAPWMFRGSERRAALDLPAEPDPAEDRAGRAGAEDGAAGTTDLVVRTRRPGDRIRPLGGPGERKLKDVLIDRRVPRERRDHLPLLCFGGRIAWVPGVTVDERFRVAPDAEAAWVAEVVPWQTSNRSSRSSPSSRSSRPTRSNGRSSTSAAGCTPTSQRRTRSS